MPSQEVAQDRGQQGLHTRTDCQPPANERAAPSRLQPVDIFEGAYDITLLAAVPGAAYESLSIRVDGRTLTLEAPLALGEANSLVSVYAEIRANHYRRSFEL